MLASALLKFRAAWPIGLIAVVVAVLAIPATAARKKVLDRSERRFDHAAHSKMVVTKLGRDEPCAGQCHTMSADFASWQRDPDDKKEHERCYAGCHQGYTHKMTTRRRALKGIEGRTCYPCHGKRLRYRPKEDNLGVVARATEVTHVATFAHRKHINPKASSAGQCESCHGAFGDQRGQFQGTLAAGHEYCSGCHGRAAEPRMNECLGCHVDRSAPEAKFPVMQPRTPSPYSVKAGFSHQAHARIKRVGREGKACLACHANIGTSDRDDVIPMPTMMDCYQSCHDGKKAFSVTGTRCTECHKKRGA
ncbi:MAG: hypothetical protein MJE77_03085 [Proteobacteria bacterium]|nr:hypothetical protein [Pseudomonadota bacterium]